MNRKDETRLNELLNEINTIFDSDKPQSYVGIIRDVNKELKELINK